MANIVMAMLCRCDRVHRRNVRIHYRLCMSSLYSNSKSFDFSRTHLTRDLSLICRINLNLLLYFITISIASLPICYVICIFNLSKIVSLQNWILRFLIQDIIDAVAFTVKGLLTAVSLIIIHNYALYG